MQKNIQHSTPNIQRRLDGRAASFDVRGSMLKVECLVSHATTALLVGLVRLYRWTLSPAKTFLFGPLAHCRFTPGCSEYALTALQTHGAATGSWLAAKRLCRCHPWGDCGHDPVPEKSAISLAHS